MHSRKGGVKLLDIRIKLLFALKISGIAVAPQGAQYHRHGADRAAGHPQAADASAHSGGHLQSGFLRKTHFFRKSRKDGLGAVVPRKVQAARQIHLGGHIDVQHAHPRALGSRS